MMKKRTINDAIIEVLRIEKRPMSTKDLFSRIIELDLYQFKAANPYHVVLTQLRRHCKGLDFPTAQKEKYYILTQEGLYFLNSTGNSVAVDNTKNAIKDLKRYHAAVVAEFKAKVLDQLKSVAPAEFELFSKKLLEVYGFSDVHITKISRDGGIDGFGKLKVGISHLNVAFQCKRWKTNKVSRPEV